MIDLIRRNIDGFRGDLRLETVSTKPKKKTKDFKLSADTADTTAEPPWLKESRKLIPGEALAGYLSLQALANPKIAQNPENVKIFLAMTFCVVTILLRWLGTQDPAAGSPGRTAQWGAVLISTLSYIFLVYSTGGQIVWHRPIQDQQLYAQILAVALGVLGPGLYRSLSPAR